jgi:hypothetical protein
MPNDQKIYQTDMKYTTSIARSSKIYPNLKFWFVNLPSGNPVINLFSSIFGRQFRKIHCASSWFTTGANATILAFTTTGR